MHDAAPDIWPLRRGGPCRTPNRYQSRMATAIRDPSTSRALRRYQTFSTEVTDATAALAARFEIYPSATQDGIVRPTRDELFDALLEDFSPYVTMPVDNYSPEKWLTLAVALTLYPVRISDADHESLDDLFTYSFHRSEPQDWGIPSDVLDMADHLVRDPLLPFRRSPISGQTLSTLVKSAAPGAMAGALLGAYLGIDHGWLLVATVPGGMIIGGSAMGIATGLEAGLHQRIVRMVSSPDSENDSSDPGDVA
jgi:hypothetical protein